MTQSSYTYGAAPSPPFKAILIELPRRWLVEAVVLSPGFGRAHSTRMPSPQEHMSGVADRIETKSNLATVIESHLAADN